MDRGLVVLYRKELADHVHSLRSTVLAALIALTSLASSSPPLKRFARSSLRPRTRPPFPCFSSP